MEREGPLIDAGDGVLLCGNNAPALSGLCIIDCPSVG